MDILNTLTEQFKRFPGIGPRQAKRFAFYLFQLPQEQRITFVNAILGIQNQIHSCDKCTRYFTQQHINQRETSCPICRDPKRDPSMLMVVSYDIDCENIEKSHSFSGYYFVLGGTLPVLEKEPEKKIRLRSLLARIAELSDVKEVILAQSPTPDGENTEDFLIERLNTLKQESGRTFNLSTLGRGLSTGLELEYSGSETIKNSLKNRSVNL